MVSSSVTRSSPRRRFTLPAEEITAVSDWAARYAPQPVDHFLVVLEVRRASRRWWVREDNVAAWCDFQTPPRRGARDIVIGLPLHLLASLSSISVFAESARVEVDLDAMTATIAADSGRVNGMLLPVPAGWVPDPFVASESCTIAGDDLFRAGLAMSVNATESTAQFPWLPFTSLTVNGGTATFIRDWRDHGSGAIEVCVPAVGRLSRTVSFWNDVVSRELVQAHNVSAPATCALSHDVPHLLSIATGTSGMLVDLGSQLVLAARRLIVSSLRHLELEPETDVRPGWNPVVRVTVADTPVEITLIEGSDYLGSHARISATVADDVPLTHELAVEIVAWNDKWTGAKAIHSGTRLAVVRDVPVTGLDGVGSLTLDLVEKTNNLREVMGVFV